MEGIKSVIDIDAWCSQWKFAGETLLLFAYLQNIAYSVTFTTLF